jgi:hypothetical protein
VAAWAALHKGPDQRVALHDGQGRVDAEPRALGPPQLELGRARRLGTSEGRRHFPKVQRPGGDRVRGRHLFFQVDQTSPSLFGHACGRQGRGHGLIPERWRTALAGMPPRLAPVLTLRGSLVQWVRRVPGGWKLHGALHVIGGACLRRTVGHRKSGFTRACRKQTEVFSPAFSDTDTAGR